MKDLVIRLRDEARPKGALMNTYRDKLWHEAADEICKLRQELYSSRRSLDELLKQKA